MIHDDLHLMPPTTTFALDPTHHHERMNRKYRYERHVFDLSGKFFLFGRERAIEHLRLEGAGSVLEIGCGTARNLKLMADRYPALRLTGIDISEEMLKSARTKVRQAGLDDRVTLLHGDAVALPIENKVPRILMSYSLSMVPDWRRALAVAIDALEPGGIMSIVDFGNFGGMPAWLAEHCIDMLSRHDASPCLDLPRELQRHATPGRMTVHRESALAGLYQLAVIERAR
jgi:S-adenosylmethionine-diacylgycerolhomoserine-N-methlytransferase